MFKSQPWIGKPHIDTVFILLPPFLCFLVIAAFPTWFQNNSDMPELAWIVLILMIDVSHVYATLYRTYFDKEVFQKQKNILIGIPLFGLLAGIFIYSLSSLWFWRLLAYIAVFHFIRQQYGFMRVYSRKETPSSFLIQIDTITIYAVTLFPLLHWHLSGPKNFNWFIQNDFIYFQSQSLLRIITFVYYIVLLIYFFRELHATIFKQLLNLPRILIVSGTALSWYFGIVYFNGDMAFTLFNVVSHGIPYMALVWLVGKKSYSKSSSKFLKTIFSKYGVLLFLSVLLLLAFVEEGFWNILVWQEQRKIFGQHYFSNFELPEKALSFIVPLLVLPQLTHYVLDGFIWRIRKNGFGWNNEKRVES